MKIITYPNPILSKKCTEVSQDDREILQILDQMAEIMYESNGVGLAAPQVGILKRLVVIDTRDEAKPELLKLINPKIISKSRYDLVESDEGCLSLPGVRATILRYEWVKVSYFNEKFEQKIIETDGLLSLCLQHEIEHLYGRLYIDHLKKTEKAYVIKKYNQKKQEGLASKNLQGDSV